MKNRITSKGNIPARYCIVKLQNVSYEIEDFVETHLRKLCGTSIAHATVFMRSQQGCYPQFRWNNI